MKLIAAALAGASAATACGSKPTVCLDIDCRPTTCPPEDASGDVTDATSEPMVCLKMPPPDASDEG